ncbi:hypothetical protein [Haloarcula onubensis]|uniref:Glycyl aminopeptidase n=1 Tax=Haloarcula onubensis TaxID=2950539 RepID=A0ABU2FP77_9EURY|nr:hypothetical protein [Halomicroarcula sp. S3CR25-11]MDS0282573.1 hypothetical protein [Halomicroarcula sp. S3CR25-11]
MVSRRTVLRSLGVSTVGVQGFGEFSVATASARSVAASPDSIREHRHFRFDAERSRLLQRYEYRLPDSVSALIVRSGWFDLDEVTVIETDEFVEDSFELYSTEVTGYRWTQDGTPSFELSMDYGEELLPNGLGGYSSETSVFGSQINPYPYWVTEDGADGSDVERSVLFEQDGYAGTDWLFIGPHQIAQRDVGKMTHTVVVPDDIEGTIDTESLLDVFEAGGRYLEPRLTTNNGVTAFIMNNWRTGSDSSAQVVGRDIRFTKSATSVDGISNVPTHEYIHTIYGIFGTEEMFWLREAAAEYYGYLLALHLNHGTFDRFVETVRTDRYRDIVLAETGPDNNRASTYYKGAHVLAALDGQIRARSSGENSLDDVIPTAEYDLSTYDGFVNAVTEAAGDESLSDWIDRYTQTTALPTIPVEPEQYTLGTASPDTFVVARSDSETRSQGQSTAQGESPPADSQDALDEITGGVDAESGVLLGSAGMSLLAVIAKLYEDHRSS